MARSGSVTVARPAISLQRGEVKLNGKVYGSAIHPVLYPGDTLTIQYQVSNSDDQGLSQVSMRYKMQLGTVALPGKLSYTISSAQQASDGWYYFGHSAPESHTHTKTISVLSDAPVQAMEVHALLELTLTAEQVN